MDDWTFDYAGWFWRAAFLPEYYENLASFILDQDAVDLHYRRKYGDVAPGEPILFKLPKNITESAKAGFGADLDNAGAVLGRQLVVVAGTYTEAAIGQFMRAFFVAKPQCMHEFLRGGSENATNGIVHLREVNEARDKSELIRMLADRAAEMLMERYRPSFTLPIIARLTNVPFENAISDRLDRDYVSRNDIIHEAHEPLIDPEIARHSFSAVTRAC